MKNKYLALFFITIITLFSLQGVLGFIGYGDNGDYGANIQTNITDGDGGVTTFTGLTDTPGTYSGAALQCLRVNSGQTGIEFFSCLISGLWQSIGGVTFLKTPEPIDMQQQNLTNVTNIVGTNQSYTSYESNGDIFDYI